MGLANLSVRSDSAVDFLPLIFVRSPHTRRDRTIIHCIDLANKPCHFSIPPSIAKAYMDQGLSVGALLHIKGFSHFPNPANQGATTIIKIYDEVSNKAMNPIVEIERRGFLVSDYTPPLDIINGTIAAGTTINAFGGILADIYKTM